MVKRAAKISAMQRERDNARRLVIYCLDGDKKNELVETAAREGFTHRVRGRKA